MKIFRVTGLLVSTVITLLVTAGESSPLLKEPSGLNVFSYAAGFGPIVSEEPSQAAPLGLGAAAEGGPTLSVRVALAETQSVDLYFAVVIPGTQGEIFLLTQEGTFLPLSSAGLVAWKKNFTGPLYVALFEGIPVSVLPAGSYSFFFAATSSGHPGNMHLWTTGVSLPGAGLEESRKATKLVTTSAGGTLNAKASDGTEYTLSIPANAVPGYEELSITLTPVTKVSGLPVSGKFIAGVSLSPDGLDLVAPASVTIHLPHHIDPAYFIGFSRSAGSLDFVPLPLFPEDFGPDSVTLRLTHFSEHGIATGTSEDLQNLSGPSKSAYDHFRGLLNDLLGDVVLGQMLGAGTYEGISPEILWQLKDVLKQAAAEAILPALRSAGDLVALHSAMQMFFQWVGDISSIFENDADLSSLVEQAGNVMGEKIPEIFHGLDQACSQENDTCEKEKYVMDLAKWTGIVQTLGGIISKSIPMPSPSVFCDGIADYLVSLIDMVPGDEWVITGGRFKVKADALNWKGITIDTPLTWSIDNPAVAEFDPETGLGKAKNPGRTLLTATATEKCGETGKAEISVVTLTGAWEASLTNHQTDCDPPKKSAFTPNHLNITQDGARLSTLVSGYGPLQGNITNFNSLRGVDPSPYKFQFGPQTYTGTSTCDVFYTNIDAFMGDASCTPNQVECIPISCEETVGVINGTITDQGTVMQGVGGSETWWEIITRDSDGVISDDETEDSCDEWGALRLTKE